MSAKILYCVPRCYLCNVSISLWQFPVVEPCLRNVQCRMVLLYLSRLESFISHYIQRHWDSIRTRTLLESVMLFFVPHEWILSNEVPQKSRVERCPRYIPSNFPYSIVFLQRIAIHYCQVANISSARVWLDIMHQASRLGTGVFFSSSLGFTMLNLLCFGHN